MHRANLETSRKRRSGGSGDTFLVVGEAGSSLAFSGYDDFSLGIEISKQLGLPREHFQDPGTQRDSRSHFAETNG